MGETGKEREVAYVMRPGRREAMTGVMASCEGRGGLIWRAERGDDNQDAFRQSERGESNGKDAEGKENW